jgi:hypothetical protein
VSAVAADPRDDLERLVRRGCQCPHGQLVEGPSLMEGKVICGVMRADQERADSILEGAPIGVVLTMRDDPSMVFGFCLGDEAPVSHPDEQRGGRIPRHYTACPIYAADKEIEQVSKRLFGEMATGDDRLPRNAEGEPILDEEPLTDGEVHWLTGDQGLEVYGRR